MLLRHAAEGDSAGGWTTWQIVPGSGCAGLNGVTGEGQIDRGDDGHHTYRLDLSFA